MIINLQSGRNQHKQITSDLGPIFFNLPQNPILIQPDSIKIFYTPLRKLSIKIYEV